MTAAGPAVLFFYPKANTPGCTMEACAFRDALAGFATLHVSIVGVSPDPVKAVTRFANKFRLGFPLLADADHAVAEAYGVWQEKSLFGRKYMGVVRTTFIVGENGKVLQAFHNVSPVGHDTEVLQWLKENL